MSICKHYVTHQGQDTAFGNVPSQSLRPNETRPSPAPPAPAALRPTVKFLLISNYVEESDNNWRGARVTGRRVQGYSRDHQTPIVDSLYTAVPSVADNLCSAGSHLKCNTAQYCHEKYKENTTFHSTRLVFPDIIKYSKKK